MQQQFLQAFRYLFYLCKTLIFIVFTIALWNDLSQVHSLIKTGITVAAVLAALTFFNPIVDIVLLLSLIALVVAVAHGNCSHPTIESGVIACGKTASEVAFNAITDLIHRLLELVTPHHGPEIIESHLVIPPAPPSWS